MTKNLFRIYREALRGEPRARSFLVASLVDDIGTVIAGWATLLMVTNLLTSQRERAKLALPALACLLAGTVISGPLADWVPAEHLANWRWRIVLIGRAVETAFLGILVVNLSNGPPTVARVMPYVLVTSFTKTALRPTRLAFSVDLLQQESEQTDSKGHPLKDENGKPLPYKTHLLSFAGMTASLATAASLTGLLVGGQIMGAVGGRYWPLFLADVLTNAGFLAIVLLRCRPPKALNVGVPVARRRALGVVRDGVVHFASTLRDGVRFLADRNQRPLLALLVGAWMVELVAEAYDGKMIVKHILGGSADVVRYAEVGWRVCAFLVVLVLPIANRWLGSIGRIFIITMLLDSVAILGLGIVAGASPHPRRIATFAAVGAIDHSLTLASTKLTEIAQVSASSTSMRGRIDAVFVFAVILGAMAVEALATIVVEAIGIPAMLVRLGFIQFAILMLIAFLGGKRLWRFGLFAQRPSMAKQDAG